MPQHFTAFVIVRNVRLLVTPKESAFGTKHFVDRLDFGSFTIKEITSRQIDDVRTLFASEDVYLYDYLLEKAYHTLPTTTSSSPAGVGGIPDDIGDLLFLLRLYKGGNIAFVKVAITKPDGETVHMFPYQAVNELNTNSAVDPTELWVHEQSAWNTFATSMVSSAAWDTPWFLTAKRFFLYGGSKEFNPNIGEVDRAIDYTIALEALLVPERDFVGKRVRNRAAALLSNDPTQRASHSALVKRLYGIRSALVHGGVLSKQETDWLTENEQSIEFLVRSVLAMIVDVAPADHQGRLSVLSKLYDITDEDRAGTIRTFVAQIKAKDVLAACAAKIKRQITKNR